MNVEDIWLANLRALVDSAANGKNLRAGYRAVAEKTGLGEEYVYQIYKGKPKASGEPRRVSLKAAKKIESAYLDDGRPAGWFNEPIGGIAEAPKKKQSTPVIGAVLQKWASEPLDFEHIVKTLNQFAEIMSALEADQREGINVYVKKLIEHADDKDSVAKQIHMIKAIIEASKLHRDDLAPPKSINSKV